ncbi:MAG: tetratricopeptide repeat protein, partial [Pseudomonadota bacterium]|nr:tetratricopeptide repeat protein [Pseudomonadota bacterium]
QNQDVPYYNKGEFDCYVTTVRLPTQTDASQWSFNSSFDTRMFGQNYYRAFELRDRAIRMIRGFRVEQREVDAAVAQRDNDRIARFDNSMASIYFDPENQNAQTASGHSIPATYEIDWAAANVPCLSPATLSGTDLGGGDPVEDEIYASANAEDVFLRSEELLREGRSEEAIAILRSAQETMPDNMELRLVQAFAELQSEQIDAAKQSLIKISLAAKNDQTDFIARGMLATLRNDHEAAIKAYSDALTITPGFGFAHMLRARAHYALSEFDLAVDDADQAIQAGVANTEVYSVKAGVAAYRGDKDGVIALVDEMLAALPKNAEAKEVAIYILNENGLSDRAKLIGATSSEEPVTMLALLNRAELRDPGDFQGKLADYGKAIELEPDAYEPYHARAELYWRNSEHEKALQDVEMALRLEAQSGETYLLKANILKHLGRNEEVGKTAEDLMAAMPGETYSFVAASQIFAAIGERARALEAIDGALAIRPEVYIFLNRAQLREPSDYAGRLADVEEALKREPKQKEGLAEKAELLRKMGDHFSAVRIYDDILSRDNSNTVALAGRGLALWKLGREDEAIKDFTAARAAARDPRDLNNLCYSKARENVALELALEECNLALDQAPMNVSVLNSRGFLYLRLERSDDAIADFNAVIERNPGVGSAYFGRGIAYEQKGDLTRATLNKDMALEHSPNIDDELGVYGFKLLN